MNGKIKLLVMDVDGTLTDGKIYMGNDGELMKAFNIKDGYGIHDILIPAGIIPVIITGRESKILMNRCKEIGIIDIHQSIYNKIEKLSELLRTYSKKNGTPYSYESVAYIGDDINDLPVMELIKASGGLVGCPADAVKKVVDTADFISTRNGGDGAVRDFIEFLTE